MVKILFIKHKIRLGQRSDFYFKLFLGVGSLISTSTNKEEEGGLWWLLLLLFDIGKDWLEMLIGDVDELWVRVDDLFLRFINLSFSSSSSSLFRDDDSEMKFNDCWGDDVVLCTILFLFYLYF